MAWFRCMVGGGASLSLTVTCSLDFAGLTITCTDGTSTLTATCPSTSPYEVIFKLPNAGTWTISGVISGETKQTTVEIPDTANLYNTPTGSTATPTDDIQIWLHCANIWDKNYSTINEVLADTTTLLALTSSNNAVDYMVRSTSWASSVCADSKAMTYIGANNYCSDILLANNAWCTAILDSTYFESVLNTKVPVMTSNTTPSGVASNRPGNTSAYKVFNNNFTADFNNWWNDTSTPDWTAYDFGKDVKVLRCKFTQGHYALYGVSWWGIGQYKIQYSDDNSTWYDGTSFDTAAINENIQTKDLAATMTKHRYWRFFINDRASTGTSMLISAGCVQFYGRSDV